MTRKYWIFLSVFIAGGTLLGVGFNHFSRKPSGILLPELAQVVEESPSVQPRATSEGVPLLSMAEPEREISRSRDQKKGRSPAYDQDSVRDENLERLIRDFLGREALAAEYEKLGEYLPDGKGVNRSIRLSILLSKRSAENENGFSEIALATRVQAEILANAESAVVSLDQALAKLPRSAISERTSMIRMLSNIGQVNPSMRTDVKAALVAEARRTPSQSEGALVFVALLRVDPSKAWFLDVTRSFEKLHPGAELSDFVALNVVAL